MVSYGKCVCALVNVHVLWYPLVMCYGKCLVRMYVLQVRGPKTREWPRGIERLGEHAIKR